MLVVVVSVAGCCQCWWLWSVLVVVVSVGGCGQCWWLLSVLVVVVSVYLIFKILSAMSGYISNFGCTVLYRGNG